MLCDHPRQWSACDGMETSVAKASLMRPGSWLASSSWSTRCGVRVGWPKNPVYISSRTSSGHAGRCRSSSRTLGCRLTDRLMSAFLDGPGVAGRGDPRGDLHARGQLCRDRDVRQATSGNNREQERGAPLRDRHRHPRRRRQRVRPARAHVADQCVAGSVARVKRRRSG